MLDSTYERLIDYKAFDSVGAHIGHIDHVYVEKNGQPLFLGIKTGWIFGRHYVVPVSQAEVNHAQEVVKLPYTEELLKGAPHFDDEVELGDKDHTTLFSYYGVTHPLTATASPVQANPFPPAEDVTDKKTIQLREEELKIGKRPVEAGGVRLRKIVRTKVVNQPVELQREEIVIERVPGSAEAEGEATFKEEDVFIPLRREEVVVEKKAHVREEVRIGKKTEVDRQDVQGEVRKEDLHIEKNSTPQSPA